MDSLFYVCAVALLFSFLLMLSGIADKLANIASELRLFREATERKAMAKEQLLAKLKSSSCGKKCNSKGGQYGEPNE